MHLLWRTPVSTETLIKMILHHCGAQTNTQGSAAQHSKIVQVSCTLTRACTAQQHVCIGTLQGTAKNKPRKRRNVLLGGAVRRSRSLKRRCEAHNKEALQRAAQYMCGHREMPLITQAGAKMRCNGGAKSTLN